MSDTAAAPAAPSTAEAAPEAAPSPRKIAPIFRTDNENDGASHALKEGKAKVARALAAETGAAPARDPRTGKFLGGGEAAPVAAPAPARSNEGGELSPDFAAREAREQEGEQTPPPLAEAPSTFSFEYNGKTFKDQKELTNFLKTVDMRARSAQSTAAQLTQVLERIQAGEVPPAIAREVEKDGAAKAVEEGPKNPFSSSIIDNQELWDRAQQDIANGDIRLGMARVVQQIEKMIQDGFAYRDHTRNESLAGVNSYFAALNQIHSIGTFFKDQTGRVDEVTGEPLYPLAQTRKEKEAQITALTKFLHRHKLDRTPENFELAYDAVVRRNASSKEQGAASTPRRVEARPPDHSQAASAAAAMALRSAGEPPSPREDSRPLSLVDSLRRDAASPKKGLFKLSSS